MAAHGRGATVPAGQAAAARGASPEVGLPVGARRGIAEYGLALGAVTAATLLGLALDPYFSHIDHALVFILAVLLVSARARRGPSLLASVAGVVAFDWFFVEPFHRLVVADSRFLLTFAVMLVVGFTVSGMAARIREQAEERAAALVAAETERTRSALLRTVSHDLRTPLASISGAAEVLLDPGAPLDDRARRELLETVRDEAGRLARLVNALLDLTRLESGTFRPARAWCPVEEIVGAALARAEGALRGRQVDVDLAPDLPPVPVDPVLLEQALVHLLENAAVHAPAGSPVEVRARPAAGGVALEVLDRGPGIPPGMEERIFEPFVRGAPGTRAPGTGLGLAICRAVLRVHGGTVVAAAREGGGAVLRCVLPVEGAPPAPAEGS